MTNKTNSDLIDVYCVICGNTDTFFANDKPNKYVCDECMEKERAKEVVQ